MSRNTEKKVSGPSIEACKNTTLYSHIFSHSALQSVQISPQSVFPTNLKATWEVVHFLVLSNGPEGLCPHVLPPVPQPTITLCNKKKVGLRHAI